MTCWSAKGTGRFLLKGWGDEFVVFDRSSAATHLIDSVSAELLQFLEGDPKTTVAVLAKVVESFDGLTKNDLELLANQRIEALHAAGFISAHPE